eukprot:5391519-Prymnesium_polylepis.1
MKSHLVISLGFSRIQVPPPVVMEHQAGAGTARGSVMQGSGIAGAGGGGAPVVCPGGHVRPNAVAARRGAHRYRAHA